MRDVTFNLFVYGTLKRGGTASHLMKDSTYIGTATVGGILYDMDGEYTALMLYGAEPVDGEVWCCPWQLLARLDAYERVSTGLFRRVGVSVQHGNDAIPCWTYVAGPRLTRRLTPSRRIRTSGRAEERKSERR
ncbi:MAG: gamma-glutamylcyclotransferase family protein [Longimicrobiales bacterium]